MTRRLSLANNRDRVAGDPVLSIVPSEPWPPGSPVPSVAASVVAAVAAELPAHARDGARRRELAERLAVQLALQAGFASWLCRLAVPSGCAAGCEAHLSPPHDVVAALRVDHRDLKKS